MHNDLFLSCQFIPARLFFQKKVAKTLPAVLVLAAKITILIKFFIWKNLSEDKVCYDICTLDEQMNLKCVAEVTNKMLQVVAVNNPDAFVLN